MDEPLSALEITVLVVLGVGLFWILPSLLCLRIAEKAGRSRWWAVLGMVPLNIFIIWAFAFVEWPSLDRKDSDTPPDDDASLQESPLLED